NEFNSRSSAPRTTTASDHVYGRLSSRLGSTCGRPSSLGDLVTPSTRRTHQHPGVNGGSTRSTFLPSPPYRQSCSGSGRQYHRLSLPEKGGGGDTLQSPSQPDLRDIPALRNPSCNIASATYSRTSQRSSRCSVSAGLSPVDGVDLRPGLLRTGLQPLGTPIQDRKSTRLNSSHVAISYA